MDYFFNLTHVSLLIYLRELVSLKKEHCYSNQYSFDILYEHYSLLLFIVIVISDDSSFCQILEPNPLSVNCMGLKSTHGSFITNDSLNKNMYQM